MYSKIHKNILNYIHNNCWICCGWTEIAGFI